MTPVLDPNNIPTADWFAPAVFALNAKGTVTAFRTALVRGTLHDVEMRYATISWTVKVETGRKKGERIPVKIEIELPFADDVDITIGEPIKFQAIRMDRIGWEE